MDKPTWGEMVELYQGAFVLSQELPRATRQFFRRMLRGLFWRIGEREANSAGVKINDNLEDRLFGVQLSLESQEDFCRMVCLVSCYGFANVIIHDDRIVA